ncbi:MAG: hypothetical protein P8I94_11685, partial [Emcibacteraceae bacterium]|nr:hypothetical protein [Emcibacteraceae bacterium]
MFYINDEKFADAFTNALKRFEVNTNHLNKNHIWSPKEKEGSSHYLKNIKGEKFILDDIEFNYILEGEYYFGYIHDLPNTIGLSNLS